MILIILAAIGITIYIKFFRDPTTPVMEGVIHKSKIGFLNYKKKFFDKKNAFEEDIVQNRNQLQIKLYALVRLSAIALCGFLMGIDVGFYSLSILVFCFLISKLINFTYKSLTGKENDDAAVLVMIVILFTLRVFYEGFNVKYLYVLPIVTVYSYFNIRYANSIKNKTNELINNSKLLTDLKDHFDLINYHRRKEFESLSIHKILQQSLSLAALVLALIAAQRILFLEIELLVEIPIAVAEGVDLFEYVDKLASTAEVKFLFFLIISIFINIIFTDILMDFLIDQLIIKHCNPPVSQSFVANCIKCGKLVAKGGGFALAYHGGVAIGALPPVPGEQYKSAQLATFNYYGESRKDHFYAQAAYFVSENGVEKDKQGKLLTDKNIEGVERWCQKMMSKAISKSVTEDIPGAISDKVGKTFFGESPPKKKE
jgi:prepilin signal peptidase PulO-like enzyme (type II secretory pathway)